MFPGAFPDICSSARFYGGDHDQTIPSIKIRGPQSSLLPSEHQHFGKINRYSEEVCLAGSVIRLANPETMESGTESVESAKIPIELHLLEILGSGNFWVYTGVGLNGRKYAVKVGTTWKTLEKEWGMNKKLAENEEMGSVAVLAMAFAKTVRLHCFGTMDMGVDETIHAIVFPIHEAFVPRMFGDDGYRVIWAAYKALHGSFPVSTERPMMLTFDPCQTFHELGWIHRDIRSTNLVWCEEEKVARLVDLGDAAPISTRLDHFTAIGTIRHWSAPVFFRTFLTWLEAQKEKRESLVYSLNLLVTRTELDTVDEWALASSIAYELSKEFGRAGRVNELAELDVGGGSKR